MVREDLITGEFLSFDMKYAEILASKFFCQIEALEGNFSFFLAMSFDMMRAGQSQFLQNMEQMNPVANLPGMEALKSQQEAFFKAMSDSFSMGTLTPQPKPEPEATSSDDLSSIKEQLAQLQEQLNKLGK